MVYTPLAGDAISLDLVYGYDPPAGNAVNLNFGGDQQVATSGVHGEGRRIPWGKMRRLDAGTVMPWRDMVAADRSMQISAGSLAQRLHPHCDVPWQGEVKTDGKTTAVGWVEGTKRQGQCQIAWLNPAHLRRVVAVPWDTMDKQRRVIACPYIVRCRDINIVRAVHWDELVRKDEIVVAPWINTIPHKDLLYRAYWGRELYERICERIYEPVAGDAINFDLDVSLVHVGDRDHIDFYFDKLSYDLRCKQREPSGWRDPYIYIKRSWPSAPKLLVYYHMNTALLTRVSDRAPVEFFRLDVAADIESWCWSINAVIPQASLPLVMPIDEPVAVEAEINGYRWVVLIESWSETSTFGRRSCQIRGRSVSSVLADPYAPSSSGSNSSAANARQLAEEQLTYTGWDIDWGIVDWLVGAGALNYSNQTPLQVIQRIVETPGGRLLSHRTDQTLLVIPRLHSNPWTWSAATPDLGINDYVVRRMSREFMPSIASNAVFVSGENQGVLAKIVRSGTAGDVVSAMVVDALITATEPAQERGRLIIGKSGKWSKEGLELPLTSSGSLPGLLDIGMLISMEERSTLWRGQVVGVKVAADRSNGLRVSQHIDVERWYGD